MHRVVTILLASTLLLAGCTTAPCDAGPDGSPAPAPPVSTTDGVVRDLDYTGAGDAAQTLDLFLPTTSVDGPAPLVLFIHGGGWQNGDKSWLEDRQAGSMVALLDLLRADGYAVASVNYRLTGQAIWPAQLDDVRAATDHLRGRATEFGLDPTRFAVAGESAGGHLAMMLGLAGEDGPEAARVSAVISYYGISDVRTLAAERVEAGCAPPPADPTDTIQGRLLGVDPASPEGAALGAQASPIAFVEADAPPLLLLHGTPDCVVPDTQSIRMNEAVRAAGGSSTIEVTEGDHGAAEFFTDPALQDAVLAFLAAALRV